jgi:glycosyltransferase involved in cell wall biosynthesis
VSDLPRLAYLTSLYPAASHTFIQREIQALRQLGFEIETCSIRRPASDQLTGTQEQLDAQSTFYVIQAARSPVNVLVAIWDSLRRPKNLLKMLALAFRTATPGIKGSLKQIAYVAEALILSHHLRRQQIDHIHNHFAGASATVTLLTSTLSGIPYSYTLHGPADFYEPYKWRLDLKTAHAKFVCCISHFARGQGLFFSDPRHWDKIHIIHCGVFPENYVSLPKSNVKEFKKILFIGRLTAVKGVRILLDAFEEARKAHPQLSLTLIGDGDDRVELEKRAAPFGDAVVFKGYQSQEAVAQALAATDALVLPSFAEGLPVVLMEAFAAGKPVICTQVAGVNELVQDGISGYIVPASDAYSLGARIGQLADDVQAAKEMGATGRGCMHRWQAQCIQRCHLGPVH